MQKLQSFLSSLDVDCQQWKVKTMTVREQLNGYDCGIYTCQWLKHLAFRVSPPDWSANDCCDFRVMIYLELAQGRLRWSDAFGTKISN